MKFLLISPIKFTTIDKMTQCDAQTPYTQNKNLPVVYLAQETNTKKTNKKKTYRKSIKILTMNIAHIRDVGQSTVPRPAISVIWRSQASERFSAGTHVPRPEA